MIHKTNVKKCITGTLLAFALIINLIIPCAADPEVASGYYVLMDASTGQVLTSSGADEKLAPAGLVKLMTALIAVENNTTNGQFVDKQISVTSTALAPLSSGIRNMSLTGGELINLSDLLYGMLLESANDAANVVAESEGGTIDDFVALMNAKAAQLGMKNTTFVNPNGLTAEGQISSPYDIALILKAALANPGFMSFFSKNQYEVQPTNTFSEDRNLRTTCLMCRNSDYYYEGSTGGMIGYTTASKYVIATTATVNNRQLIVVVMKDEDEPSMYKDAKALLDYGFNEFSEYEYSTEGLTTKVPITEGGVKVGEANFMFQGPIMMLLRNDYDATNIEPIADLPTAIQKGKEGTYTANIYYKVDDNNKILLREGIPLVVTETFDPVPTDTSQTGIIATDASGNILTDASGNIITIMPNGQNDSSGFMSGILRFIKVFFIILLIIIGIVAGLILIFIATLFIIKYVKRYKRKKARRRARMQAHTQRRNDNNNLY